MRRLPVIVVAALSVGALSGVAAYENSRPRVAHWREIAWPLPRDGWPAGRAFRCDAAWCGDEVDRVADLDLISERFVPLAAGEVVRVAEMPGRSRAYDLRMPDGARHSAVGIAVSRRCDLLVAVAQGKGAAAAVRRVALDFLALDAVTQWMT